MISSTLESLLNDIFQPNHSQLISNCARLYLYERELYVRTGFFFLSAQIEFFFRCCTATVGANWKTAQLKTKYMKWWKWNEMKWNKNFQTMPHSGYPMHLAYECMYVSLSVCYRFEVLPMPWLCSLWRNENLFYIVFGLYKQFVCLLACLLFFPFELNV